MEKEVGCGIVVSVVRGEAVLKRKFGETLLKN